MFSSEWKEYASAGSNHMVFVITLIFHKIIQILDQLKNYKYMYLKSTLQHGVNQSSVFNIHP